MRAERRRDRTDAPGPPEPAPGDRDEGGSRHHDPEVPRRPEADPEKPHLRDHPEEERRERRGS